MLARGNKFMPHTLFGSMMLCSPQAIWHFMVACAWKALAVCNLTSSSTMCNRSVAPYQCLSVDKQPSQDIDARFHCPRLSQVDKYPVHPKYHIGVARLAVEHTVQSWPATIRASEHSITKAVEPIHCGIVYPPQQVPAHLCCCPEDCCTVYMYIVWAPEQSPTYCKFMQELMRWPRVLIGGPTECVLHCLYLHGGFLLS